MTATNLAEDAFLDLYFTNVDFPNVGDAAGLQNSAAAGSLNFSLHVGDAISDTSTQQTDNEVAYTGYGRAAVARSLAEWTVASGNVDNDNAMLFGEMTAGGPDTVTDVGIGFANTGTGELHIWSQLVLDLIINNGVDPQFAAGDLDVSLD